MGKATWAALAYLAFLAAASAVTLDNVAQDSFDFNYQGVQGVRVPSSACRRTLSNLSTHLLTFHPRSRMCKGNYDPARKPHQFSPPLPWERRGSALSKKETPSNQEYQNFGAEIFKLTFSGNIKIQKGDETPIFMGEFPTDQQSPLPTPRLLETVGQGRDVDSRDEFLG